MLLEETLPADPVGHADHGERAIGKVRQDKRRDQREVAQQVALGERRLLERGIRGPVDAIEVRQADTVRSYRDRERGLRCFQLRHDFVDRAAGGYVGKRGRLRRPAAFRAAHRLRIDVIAQPQENRRAQMIVVGPILKTHFRDDIRLDPCRRCIELRLLHEWAGTSLQRIQRRLYLLERGLVKAGTYVRSVAQLSLVPVADKNRTQRRA